MHLPVKTLVEFVARTISNVELPNVKNVFNDCLVVIGLTFTTQQ